MCNLYLQGNIQKKDKSIKHIYSLSRFQESSLTVDCFKEDCPRLTSCLASEAIRPDPLSCCKVCPEIPDQSDTDIIETESDTYPVITNIDSQKLNDMGVERSGLDILTSGGCAWKGNYHENGDSWHPHVMPWGQMKCVTCSCKVSKDFIFSKYLLATFLSPIIIMCRYKYSNNFRMEKRNAKRSIAQN